MIFRPTKPRESPCSLKDEIRLKNLQAVYVNNRNADASIHFVEGWVSAGWETIKDSFFYHFMLSIKGCRESNPYHAKQDIPRFFERYTCVTTEGYVMQPRWKWSSKQSSGWSHRSLPEFRHERHVSTNADMMPDEDKLLGRIAFGTKHWVRWHLNHWDQFSCWRHIFPVRA